VFGKQGKEGNTKLDWNSGHRQRGNELQRARCREGSEWKALTNGRAAAIVVRGRDVAVL
jgi:hypothetical protein